MTYGAIREAGSSNFAKGVDPAQRDPVARTLQPVGFGGCRCASSACRNCSIASLKNRSRRPLLGVARLHKQLAEVFDVLPSDESIHEASPTPERARTDYQSRRRCKDIAREHRLGLELKREPPLTHRLPQRFDHGLARRVVARRFETRIKVAQQR